MSSEENHEGLNEAGEVIKKLGAKLREENKRRGELMREHFVYTGAQADENVKTLFYECPIKELEAMKEQRKFLGHGFWAKTFDLHPNADFTVVALFYYGKLIEVFTVDK